MVDVIEMTVNMSDGMEQTYKASLSSLLPSLSVREAIDEAVRKFPNWTSMIVVFTNPKA